MEKREKLWTRSLAFVKENLWFNYGQITDKSLTISGQFMDKVFEK